MALTMHNGHDSLSRPGSQDPSPSSPTASFITQQQYSSRSPYPSDPGTPTYGSLDPPHSMSFAAFMQTWSDYHVAKWLTDHRLAHLAPSFKENDIRGDVLLDLNQSTLKEMGITSVGERIRLINAIKILRQKYVQKPLHDDPPSSRPTSRESSPTRRDFGKRLESTRPAPLQLNSHSARSDLPRLVKDGQDSSKSSSSIRPLPHPGRSSHSSTPHAAYLSRPNLPPLPPPPQGLPPLPPNGQSRPGSATQSSGRKTSNTSDANPYNNQPSSASSHPHGLLTPTGATGLWTGYGLPSDPRPGNRTPVPSSPLFSQRLRSPVPGAVTHGRNTSMSSLNPNFNPPTKLPPRPSTGQNPYPFTTPTYGSTLSAAQQLANLSPIAESFVSQSNSPSPPASSTSYRPGTGPLRPTTPLAPTLDDLKRKLVRFQLPGAIQSCTINTDECADGIEILEMALKKLKVLSRNTDQDDSIDDIGSNDGELSVDGWRVFLDVGQSDLPNAKPLTESQLLAFCHSPPDDPVRGHSLIVRRTGRGKRSKALHQIFGEEPPPTPLSGLTFPEDEDHIPSSQFYGSSTTDQADLETVKSKKAKRASTVSVLSGLGVQDPEKALELPKPASPIPNLNTARSSSKLRNFFGQRPPSELITNHLAEYFPYTEKKVLERTRRRSVFRNSVIGPGGRRDSIVSWNPGNSRFSISSHGSHRPPSMMSSRASVASERVPFSNALADDAASMYSRDGGETAVDETQQRPWSADDGTNGEESDSSSLRPSSKRMSQLRLPPVKFPSESLTDSFNELTGAGRRASRALSIASSKRASLIMEVKSKRDWSDVASLITVDEITAEVENRRETAKPVESSDEWTKVDFEDGLKQDSEPETLPPQPEDLPVAVADEEAVEDEDDIIEDEEEEEEEEEDEDNDGEEAEDELTDDGHGKSISTQQGEKTIKWIKGALIGAGSFGQVYLGMDAATGLLMAVKQVSLPTGTGVNQERKKSMLSALEREIELLKDLQHENIVQYHTSCIDDEHLNIFLEYVPGGSVTALLRNYGAFEEPLVRNFVRQILQGLNYLHERDIIHRDIKGGNILVDNKGGIKISDFGISKKVEDSVLGGSRAHRPSLQGSVFWMAPEVVKQTAYTRKADIWSVGCLVVEMLTGEHPWAELTQMQAIFKIGSSAIPTIPSDISSEAESFLLLTFELDHEARPDASVLLQHAWVIKPKPKLDTLKPPATEGSS